MPSTRPCAAFEPIAPDFDLKHLVETTENFKFVTRIQADMIAHRGIDQFEKLVLHHVILGGQPLVIEGYEQKLDKWIFAIQWLKDNCGTNVADVRNLSTQVNVPMTIGHYLKHMGILTNQWTNDNYKETDRQRMYMKDIDCPAMWQERVKEHIPPVLFYLNESTGEHGGLGAMNEPDASGTGVKTGRGIAHAGDLMSSLPKEMRADNLMCYIGHEGTYTPAHREMCASLGQNIMVEASDTSVEEGERTKAGSSIWFMTSSKEREVVAEYWLSRLGHDIEVEKHFAQINAWKNAPFTTYVVEQKPGNFILIPPLAPHQVWNRGTRTMKIAWNRTTVETLEMAMDEALPKARMVCRDEQYKNKAIIYYSLIKYSRLLRQAEQLRQKNPQSRKVLAAAKNVEQLGKDFKRLHAMYTRILVSESFLTERPEKKVEMIPYDSNITCSYCRCNIFNRFLTCPSCVVDLAGGEKDTYDICLECYAMGRSCACISKLRWVEQFDWTDLVQKHDQWRLLIRQQIDGRIDENSPRSLKHELDRLGKQRTLAQICQTELLKRPWRDIRKPDKDIRQPNPEEEIELDANGNVKKKRVKRKTDAFLAKHGRCHVDSRWEPSWKQATCTKCAKNYCYGLLFRAYDEMPQDVMAQASWKCPSCRHICGCRTCRKQPDYRRYIPKGTLLGHDTRAVADPRSVESLVDFSYSNLKALQSANDDVDTLDTRRMQKRVRAANRAMNADADLGNNYVDDMATPDATEIEGGLLRLARQEGIPIDPQLGATADMTTIPEDDDDIDLVADNPEQMLDNVLDLDQSYALPSGMILQNTQLAYDQTNAITFTYPDPASAPSMPPPPVEGYQEATLRGDEPIEPSSPDRIEMESRKRKRRLDDGERAFVVKKGGNQYKKAAKARASLVIRFSVNKERLREIDSIAREKKRLEEEKPAPVVGSDLQALNVVPTDGQPLTKKARTDDRAPVEREKDTEYAPGRARDRRKALADGVPPPPRDDDNITRRQTRGHDVRYVEMDEEEFNEVVKPKDLPSKLDTMSGAVLDSIENTEPAMSDEIHDISDVDAEGEEDIQASGQGVSKIAFLNSRQAGPDKARDMAEVRNSVQHSARTPNAKTTTKPGRQSMVEMALAQQAEANRKTKMALEDEEVGALDNSDSDAASFEMPHDFSPGEVNQPAQTPASTIQASVPVRDVTNDNDHDELPDISVLVSTKPAPATILPSNPHRQSLPVLPPPKQTTSTPVQKPPLRPQTMSATSHSATQISRAKASANAWGDSDSSDDESPPARTQPASARSVGFMSVNGPGNHNHAAVAQKIGHHIVGKGKPRGRPRGRPRAR